MQQILFKKNSFNLDVDQRSSKTNQLTSSSKVARVTDAENFALNTYGADYALKEMLSARADDSVAKTEMMRNIANEGYCRLVDLSDDVANKQTLNTVDVYFTGAGLVTDLLTPGLMFRRTLDERNKRSATKEKYEESANNSPLTEDEIHTALTELFYKALQVGSDKILGEHHNDNINEASVSGIAQVASNQATVVKPYEYDEDLINNDSVDIDGLFNYSDYDDFYESD
jgi:hypothetical protein